MEKERTNKEQSLTKAILKMEKKKEMVPIVGGTVGSTQGNGKIIYKKEMEFLKIKMVSKLKDNGNKAKLFKYTL